MIKGRSIEMAASTRKKSLFFIFVTLLCFVTLFQNVAGNCKTHDASWDAAKGPTVTQPSRVDPTKIKIDWSHIVTNGRCVDEYYVYVWKKSSPKETAIKIPVGVKNAVSHTVDVEACIDYNFAVESVEHDLFRDDIHQSVATSFKSEAIPRLTSTNKKDFKISYYFDKTRGVHDLAKVSIRFPKSILEHASCIKHIEVKGVIDTLLASQSGRSLYSHAASSSHTSSSSDATHGYYLRSQSSSSTYSSSSSVGGHGQYPGTGVGGQGQYPGGSGVGGQGQYPGGSGVGGQGQKPGGSGVGGQGQYPGGSGVGGQGQYPGGSGVGGQGQYPGGSGVGGQGQYPGGSGVGGQGQYPGGSGVGGQGQYPGGSGVGGQGQYPGGSGVGGQGSYPGSSSGGRPNYNPEFLYPDHTHTQGWHGRPPFNQPSGGGHFNQPGRYRRAITTTTGRPPIAPQPTTRPPFVTGQPSVTASPPFLLDVIEILVDNVEPCKPYRFNLKIVSPQGTTLGEIDSLILPPLPEMADYHPPPLAQLFKVQLQGPGQPPLITLQPGLGVPATCLADFFEAVDRHMQRLEADLAFHLGQESKAHGSIDYFKKQLADEGSAQLKLLGCKCNSTTVVLSTKDATVESKFNSTFGTYTFDGLHNAKPYYRKPSRHHQVHIPVPQVAPAPQVPGVTSTTTTTTTTPPPPAAAGVKVFYLYWDSSDKVWMVAETLGSHSPTHKTLPKSLATCPADPENVKTWTHTSTFKWKEDPTMKFDCVHNTIP